MTQVIDLLELQVGKESSDAWGTAVAPTKKLMGITNATIQPVEDVAQVEEMRGTLQPAYRSVVNAKHGEATVEGHVIYEEFPYWAEALFILDTDNPDTDTWDWSAPSESSDMLDPRVQTLVLGDGTYVWGLNGGTLQEITLSGETGGPLMYEAALFGKSVSSDTLASLSDASDSDVTYAMGDHVVLYIDPGSDAVGTTAVSDAAFSFEATINTGREMLRHLGDQAPSSYFTRSWSGDLSLTLEVNATTEAFLKSIIAATTEGVYKNVRIKATSGTYVWQLDFGGVLLEAPEIFTDEDGVTTIELTLTGHKTSGMTYWCAMQIVNAGTALS